MLVLNVFIAPGGWWVAEFKREAWTMLRSWRGEAEEERSEVVRSAARRSRAAGVVKFTSVAAALPAAPMEQLRGEPINDAFVSPLPRVSPTSAFVYCFPCHFRSWSHLHEEDLFADRRTSMCYGIPLLDIPFNAMQVMKWSLNMRSIYG